MIIALLSLVITYALLNGLSEVLQPHNTYKNKVRFESNTKVFLDVYLEDFDVLILIEPLVDVKIKVTAIANGFALNDLLL